jgi:hypothetical protein
MKTPLLSPDIIREIFALYLNGRSRAEIAAMLNAKQGGE